MCQALANPHINNVQAFVKNQLDERGLDIEDWHRLSEIKGKFTEASQKYTGGEEQYEEEVTKWAVLLDSHPEYKKELERQADEWAATQQPLCDAAWREMRRFVPPNVASMGAAELTAAGLPTGLARRLVTRKALWLIVAHPDDTAKLHHADLFNKYVGSTKEECPP